MSLTTQPPPTEIAKPTEPTLRVLVVDDNVDAAKILEMLVQESGHLVRMAHTGPTALAAALDYRPDVMLLDIGLPELDGYEVAKRIRQEPLLHDIVLVAITGYEQEADRQRVAGSGLRSPLGQARRFREGATDLGGRLGEGDLTPTDRQHDLRFRAGPSRGIGEKKEPMPET